MFALTVDASALKNAVAFAAAACPANPSLPIQRGIHLKMATHGEQVNVTLTGYDHMRAVCNTVTIDAHLESGTVDDGQHIIIAGATAKAMITTLPGPVVTLSLDDGAQKLSIDSESTHFAAPLMTGDWISPERDGAEYVAVTVDADAWKSTTACAHKASGKDTSIPVLTGAQVVATGSEVTVTSTDRYRLFTGKVDVLSDADSVQAEVIVPAKELDDVSKMLCKNQDTATVELSANGIRITAGRASTRIGSLDGDFPRWKQLIPTDLSQEVTVDGEVLAAALNRAAVATDKANVPARLELDPDAATMKVMFTDDTEFSDTIAADGVCEAMTIGINPNYLKDGIEAVGSAKVMLGVVSATRPLLVQGEASHHKYLAMPVKLASA